MNLCDSTRVPALTTLLARYGLTLAWQAPGAAIPGSYWGAPEAGLIETVIHVRDDTPLHSALHEAAHVLCMDDRRRDHLHTDAGGDYAEEDAVCYLQIVLARELGLSPAQMCANMDAWGAIPSASARSPVKENSPGGAGPAPPGANQGRVTL